MSEKGHLIGFDGDPEEKNRYVDDNPLTVVDLVEMLGAGDIGEVEFTELMLEKGQSFEIIGAHVAKAREEF